MLKSIYYQNIWVLMYKLSSSFKNMVKYRINSIKLGE